MAEEVDVQLVGPPHPAPGQDARPAQPGPALDLLLEALGRLGDVLAQVGVDGHCRPAAASAIWGLPLASSLQGGEF